MLKDRASLENNIQTHLTNINLDKEKTEAICNYCFTNYNIPRSLTADYIGKRQSLSEASEFILFVLFQAHERLLKLKNLFLSKLQLDVVLRSSLQAYVNMKFLRFSLHIL